MLKRQPSYATVRIYCSILFVLFAANGCTPQKQPSRALKSTTSGDASPEKTPEPMVQGTEVALSGLPENCEAAAALKEGKQCISCKRTAEGGPVVLFNDLCFAPVADFNPKLHCSYEGTKEAAKFLACKSTTDETGMFDLSLGNERASEILPLVLAAIKSGISEKLAADSPALKIAEEVLPFASAQLPLLLEGKDFDKIADGILALAIKHATSPLSEEAKAALLTNLKTGLKAYYVGLASSKDLTLAKAISGILAVGRLIPADQLGKASVYFSTDEISSLLEKKKAEVEPLILQYGALIGVKSFEDLIAQIKSAT